MSTTPAFASTVVNAAAILGSAETSLTAPAQSSTLVSAGASGTQITEIVVEAVTTSLAPVTVAGLVYVFLYDGATYHLHSTIAVTAVTGSATVAPFRASTLFTNLFLKSGWSLRLSQSIAGNASLLKVNVIGADF